MASATSVPLADALGGWAASLLAWVPLAALALLAWVPMARAVRRHAVPDAPPTDDVSHALPWASLTAWLRAAVLTGSPGDLTLALFGRLRVADVQLTGPQAAVDAGRAVL